MKEVGLYIHIPFCKQKCYYCDFCSFANKLELQEEYINAAIAEMEYVSRKNQYLISTVYVGGGTPSIINPELIEKLLNSVKKLFKVKENAEITIEINPGTANKNKIELYKRCGINRASIGLQSTNNKLLKEIGRIHNFEDFENVYELVKEVGINNINVDLMIGLPNQSLSDVEESVKKVIEKSPQHVSVYSLIVEPETKMEKLIESKELTLPDENVERDMYWLVKKILSENGYNHYEISNFSKKGFESKHKTDCWNQKEYIGIGVSAHSYLEDVRFSNIESIEEYIKNIKNNDFKENIIIHEEQSKESKMREYMIIGLRMLKGIDASVFEEKFNENPFNVFKKEIDELENINLVEVTSNNLKLTKKGLDFANIVWEKFV